MQYDKGLPTLVNRLAQLAEYKIPVFSRPIESRNFDAEFRDTIGKLVAFSGEVTIETVEPIPDVLLIHSGVPKPFIELCNERYHFVQCQLDDTQAAVYKPLARNLARAVDGSEKGWQLFLNRDYGPNGSNRVLKLDFLEMHRISDPTSKIEYCFILPSRKFKKK